MSWVQKEKTEKFSGVIRLTLKQTGIELNAGLILKNGKPIVSKQQKGTGAKEVLIAPKKQDQNFSKSKKESAQFATDTSQSFLKNLLLITRTKQKGFVACFAKTATMQLVN